MAAILDFTHNAMLKVLFDHTTIWMASGTSGLTHIKKTMKINYVIDSNDLINIRVLHSGLDHFVTDFATFLC